MIQHEPLHRPRPVIQFKRAFALSFSYFYFPSSRALDKCARLSYVLCLRLSHGDLDVYSNDYNLDAGYSVVRCDYNTFVTHKHTHTYAKFASYQKLIVLCTIGFFTMYSFTFFRRYVWSGYLNRCSSPVDLSVEKQNVQLRSDQYFRRSERTSEAKSR